MKSILKLAVLMAMALFFTACENETKKATVVEKSPNKQERIEPLKLTTTKGESIEINLDSGVLVSDDLNGKVVLVNFFATWCPPCIEEIPTFNRLYKQYADKFEIVAILYQDDKSKEELKAFIKKHNIQFPITVGENNLIAAKMFGDVKKIPESFIFSEDGFMLQKFVGIVDEGLLEGYITNEKE